MAFILPTVLGSWTAVLDHVEGQRAMPTLAYRQPPLPVAELPVRDERKKSLWRLALSRGGFAELDG
jgi:hypothetical protein